MGLEQSTLTEGETRVDPKTFGELPDSHLAGPSSSTLGDGSRRNVKQPLPSPPLPTTKAGRYYFHSVPPNGGYGWIVVLGCFISHVVFGGIERSEGIFFLEFREKFDKNVQLSSLPGALVTGLRLFVAPLAAGLSYKYGVRLTCILGSALMFSGMVLNAFVTDFNMLFLTHAILQGFGRGFLYTPSLIIVADYFDKKRGIANGLSTSGTGIGTFFLAPLLQFLFNFYGYTGAFMIIGALSLNTAISAVLYKPLLPRKISTAPRLCQMNKTQDSMDKLRSSDQFAELLQASQSQLPKQGNAEYPQLVVSDSQSSGSVRQFMKNREEVRQKRQESSSDDAKREDSHSILSFVLAQTKKMRRHSSKLSSINVDLLKNPAFILFCISITLFTAASKSIFTFIPALMTSKGYTPVEAAVVLSITGATDIIGRIFAGLLFDSIQSRLIRPIICNVLIVILAIVTGILPLLNGYNALSLTCGINSFLTGAYVSQKTVISMDVLGPYNVPRSIGFFIFFQGVGTTVGVPLMAAMEANTNSYDLSFYLCGALMIGAGFFMTLCISYIRSQERELALYYH